MNSPLSRTGIMLAALAPALAACTNSAPMHEPPPSPPATAVGTGGSQQSTGTGGNPAPMNAGQGAGGQTAAPTPKRDAGEVPRPKPDAATTSESDATVAVAPKCPDAAALSAGDHDQSLMHDGSNRSYILHVPPGYDGKTALPVVADFHGYSSSAAGQQRTSGWDALADTEMFLVIYPEGIASSWNIGNDCCGTAGTSNVDDIGFIKAVIADLAGLVCVDPKRIYASGLSNGGGFAHRIGCDAADVFAAVAPVSTDLRTSPCMPARPISVIAFRGTGDALEQYEGGEIGPPGMTSISPGAQGSLALWKGLDGCTGTAVKTAEYCETFSECAEGVEVALCTMPDVGHVPYDNALGFDIVRTAWEMFARHPMP